MDTRPSKRQRRFTVHSSDTDDEQVEEIDDTSSKNDAPISNNSRNDANQPPEGHSGANSKRLPLLSSRPKTIPFSREPSQPPANAYSRSPSPEKRKQGTPSSHRSTAESLHGFFKPASSEQRWSSQKLEPTRPPDTVTEKAGDEDDLIEDDYDSFDELFTQHFMGGDTGVQNDTKSRENRDDKLRQRPPSLNSDRPRKSTAPTKRFLMPPSPDSSSQSRPSSVDDATGKDRRPWAQKYGPSNLDELAVHKRKVSDVQNWLDNVFTGRNRRRLLVLRGPAGSGKTTTVSLLSKASRFDILEWKNPSALDFSTRGYTSINAQFEEFLGRGDKFGELELDGADGTLGGREGRDSSPSQRRIMLIEEFPTVLSRNSSGLAAFRLSLQRYLAAATPPNSMDQTTRTESEETMNPPIVIIVSETLLGSASSVLDNLTAHRLLGADICNHPSTTVIDFNVIAPTFMLKALRLVLEKDARRSKRVQIPGPAVLERVSEIGDIRSAISSLEFLCLKGDKVGAWGGKLNPTTKKSSWNRAELTPMETESLKMVTQREASLGIFHAVGKIVYNKREDASLTMEGVRPPSPPDHLHHHDRRKVSQVCVNELIDETGTDIQTFISALHENYVPSCEGLSFTECLNDCIDTLSDSDMLCVDQRGSQRHGAKFAGNFSAGVDMLRQEEISYQIATRGLLFALPHPVKRSVGSTNGPGRGNDAHKMTFPTSLQLWHESEEIEGLLDLWLNRLLNPFSMPISHADGIQRWKSRQVGYDMGQTDFSGPQAKTVTMMSRNDALLYQLPYMARISQSEAESKELRRITGFHCTEAPNSNRRANAKHRGHENSSGPQLPPSLEDQEEKLILSDDDIMDD